MLSLQKLIGTKVETKLGRDVGRLKDFAIDQDTLQIRTLIISPSGLVKKLIASDLLIASSAVISVSEKLIIVDEASVSEKGTRLAAEFGANISSTSPLTSSIVTDGSLTSK